MTAGADHTPQLDAISNEEERIAKIENKRIHIATYPGLRLIRTNDQERAWGTIQETVDGNVIIVDEIGSRYEGELDQDGRNHLVEEGYLPLPKEAATSYKEAQEEWAQELAA